MPGVTEKLSHREPTFFAHKKVLATFDNDHHNSGHVAVWIPAQPGVQALVIATSPDKFFKPPHVGTRGWIGIELDRIDDDELASYLLEAWRMVAPKPRVARSAQPMARRS